MSPKGNADNVGSLEIGEEEYYDDDMEGRMNPPTPGSDDDRDEFGEPAEANHLISPSKFGRRIKRRESVIHLAFGISSIFDVKVEEADGLPFDLPVKDYISETLSAMHGAPSGKNNPATDRWKQLRTVCDTAAAADYCGKLFWLTMGVLFDAVSDEAAADLRRQMSRLWFLLSLELGKRRIETRDWLNVVIPVVFVQTNYRLLVDAFPPDRQSFADSADVMIDKMMEVMHYEAAGFQSNPDTWRRLRQQLFRPHVIEAPFVNMLESMRNEQRLEKLQSQKTKLQPLAFGKESARPLDETQLEQIMELRRSEGGMALRKTQDGKPVMRSSKGMRHSQENYKQASSSFLAGYAVLSQKGDDLFMDQVLELKYNRPKSTTHYSEGSAYPFADTMRCTTNSEDFDSGPSSLNNTRNLRHVPLNRSSQVDAETQRRERREIEVAERRRRDEVLQDMIIRPLPKIYAVRAINTGHVSPTVDTLAPSQAERGLLQKQGREVLKVKMKPPVAHLLPTIKNVKAEEQQHGDISPSSTAQVLPKLVRGQSSVFRPAALAKTKPATSEVIILEAPASVDTCVIDRRLEEQSKAARHGSFEQYKKDYDLYSGARKQKYAPERLHEDERNYVQRVENLVGSRSEPSLKLPRFHESGGVFVRSLLAARPQVG